MIVAMADEYESLRSVTRLLDDLSKEYYALLDVVSEYDGRALTVKGWSVTLSLASLGIGLQQGHAGLFLLAALTGLAFWYIDLLMKGFQFRYYVRMRDIEYAAYLANRVPLHDPRGFDIVTSAPRVEMTWGF